MEKIYVKGDPGADADDLSIQKGDSDVQTPKDKLQQLYFREKKKSAYLTTLLNNLNDAFTKLKR